MPAPTPNPTLDLMWGQVLAALPKVQEKFEEYLKLFLSYLEKPNKAKVYFLTFMKFRLLLSLLSSYRSLKTKEGPSLGFRLLRRTAFFVSQPKALLMEEIPAESGVASRKRRTVQEKILSDIAYILLAFLIVHSLLSHPQFASRIEKTLTTVASISLLVITRVMWYISFLTFTMLISGPTFWVLFLSP